MTIGQSLRRIRAHRRIVADIKRHGWHVINVLADDSGPAFSYSIGMFRTLGHPEIIMFGLPSDWMHRHINAIGDAVREGARFDGGSTIADLLEGFECVFVRVPVERYPQLVGQALWFYRDASFPLIQCVWPDKQRLYPWQPGFVPELIADQPVMGVPLVRAGLGEGE
jgi:uncharacterized protein DUF4262